MTRAIGRFGMRIFEPTIMAFPHWHGHVELNVLTGAEMDYDLDGIEVTVPPDRPIAFWAGIPHQLTRIRPRPGEEPRLANIYIPLDAFLGFTAIGPIQIAMLGGALIELPPFREGMSQLDRWYADYRTNDFERRDLLKMELNVMFRRATLDGFTTIVEPQHRLREQRLNLQQTGHVVAMLRYILESLESPISNRDIAGAAGLHENYALTLFSNVMGISMKQFVIRMRLLRARAIILESAAPIGQIAYMTGFSSSTQFYHHFKTKYGITPSDLRTQTRYGTV